MQNFGFVRIAAAMPRVRLADVKSNCEKVCSLIEKAEQKKVSVLSFPELCLTGYTCADIFGQQLLLSEVEASVVKIRDFTRGKDVLVIVGAPVSCNDRLYNCAIVIRNGQVKGIVPKIYLPNYHEFYEARWFASGEDFLFKNNIANGNMLDNAKDYVRDGFSSSLRYGGMMCNINPNQLFKVGDATVAIEICEDLWTPVPPSSYHAMAGANLIVNLSASNELIGKHAYRKSLVANQSARTVSAYLYCSAGYGESTQDLVFAGSSMICENGSVLCENERFAMDDTMIVADVDIEKLKILRQKQTTFYSVAPDGTRASSYANNYLHLDLGPSADTDFEAELLRRVEARPFVPVGNPEELASRSKEITSIQVMGLATRLQHINCQTAVIGVSGGLDSTLALLITVMAFDRLGWDRKRILGVTMPGFGTTGRTYHNSLDLMKALGITSKEISIVPSVNQHFEDIGQDPQVHDVTYENCQARERTQILMDLANKTNGMVVGTGDISEMALGWETYNGDHMSMYAVNASIPKTLVKYLVKWTAENKFSSDAADGETRSARDILMDIFFTPISPELLPADEKGNIKQKTEDLVGPYDLHDFFLYNFFRFGYSPKKIFFLAKKAFAGEFDEETIKKWLKKFMWRYFSQQFKRSCMPDAPKVGSVSLSPRGDLRMPSDAISALFYNDLD